jgi:hypothetical protein
MVTRECLNMASTANWMKGFRPWRGQSVL